jgi:hypothetical protein
MNVIRTLALGAIVLACGAAQGADEVIWQNVTDFPGGLEKTDAGWSAIRIEQEGFSYRVAADDFILKETRRISRIEFWTCNLSNNPLLGIDWYIFSGPPEGPPDTLIAYASDVPATHTDTGIVNQSFGTVYSEMAEVNIALDPGHYFLAFRSVHQNAGEKGNGCLTTYDSIGDSRGWWSFTLQADGTGGAWDKMEIFNLQNNEWAFRIYAETGEDCYADFDGNGALDLFDFLAYVNSFNAGEDAANCDGEGGLDLFDFLCYVNAFNEGC